MSPDCGAASSLWNEAIAGRQVGLVVEDVIRKDEIVIKSLGEYLRNLKMFPGATIAPNGSLILLIDVNRLVAGEAIEKRPLMTSATAARIFARYERLP